MQSSPEQLFASIRTEADLNMLRIAPREEDLYLEFKQKSDRRDGKIGDDDRRNFSKAVGGFANADGGVLIWGVETKKREDGIDYAYSLKPIRDHASFCARLKDSLLTTTQPVVDGVEIVAIDSQEEPGAGYVKCFVPPSDRPPHCSIHCDRQYLRRGAAGHRSMDHYELEDIFGRRLRPVLRLFVDLNPRSDNDPFEELRFYLTNEGRGVAKHSGFLCMFMTREIQVDVRQSEGFSNATALNGGTPTISFDSKQKVFHPNGILSYVGKVILKREAKNAPLEVEAKVFAENMKMRSAKATIAPGDRQQIA